MGKDNIFLGMVVLLFIIFMELVRLIFNLYGLSFGVEILLFFGFLLIALIISMGLYFEASWAFPGCLVLFGSMFLNVLFFYTTSVALLTTNLHALTLIFGFFIALVNLRTYENPEEDFMCEDTDFDVPKGTAVTEIVEEKKEAVKKTSFSPGKYIASKSGVKYHIPKCGWAKRIGRKNKEWLKDKKEAKAKGYKPCECVK